MTSMKNKIKSSAFAIAMGLGLTAGVNANGSDCEQSCVYKSWQMQASYCAQQNGGSACASSPYLNKHFYDVCLQQYCYKRG